MRSSDAPLCSGIEDEETERVEPEGVELVRQIWTDGADPDIDRIFPSGSALTRAPPHPNILKMGSTRPGWISSTNQTHGKCAWPGEIWGWVTDREVLPGCARVRTKCAEKTGVGL